METTIDFADEDDAPNDVTSAVEHCLSLLGQELRQQLGGAEARQLIRDGVSVAIVGPPNAGKSSLINVLAQKEIAIVSDTPGTTRDVLELLMDVKGFLVRIQDTAGLRDTFDKIESLGIARAKAAAERADLVLCLRELGQESLEIDQLLHGKFVKFVNTKADILDARPERQGIWLSTITGEGIGAVLEAIYEFCALQQKVGADSVVVNQRQRRCLKVAADCVEHARSTLACGDPEIVCEDLRLAAQSLSSITGAIGVENVLGEIFSRFCIGK